MKDWTHAKKDQGISIQDRTIARLEQELSEARSELTVLRARTQRTYHAADCKLMQYDTSPSTECSCGYSHATEAQAIQAKLARQTTVLEKCEIALRDAWKFHYRHMNESQPTTYYQVEEAIAELDKLKKEQSGEPKV